MVYNRILLGREGAPTAFFVSLVKPYTFYAYRWACDDTSLCVEELSTTFLLRRQNRAALILIEPLFIRQQLDQQ